VSLAAQQVLFLYGLELSLPAAGRRICHLDTPDDQSTLRDTQAVAIQVDGYQGSNEHNTIAPNGRKKGVHGVKECVL
jgi:hypothetical protein